MVGVCYSTGEGSGKGVGGGDGLSGAGQACCWLGRSGPALTCVLTSPSCGFVAFPSLPFHFRQLMSGTSTLNDVLWTPGDKAEARCRLALWAGPAVPFPSRPPRSPGQGPPGQLRDGLWPDPMQMLPRRGLSRRLSPAWLCRGAEQVCPGASAAQQRVSDVTWGAGEWCGGGGGVCQCMHVWGDAPC